MDETDTDTCRHAISDVRSLIPFYRNCSANKDKACSGPAGPCRLKLKHAHRYEKGACKMKKAFQALYDLHVFVQLSLSLPKPA
jgi:hypothetical protein